MVFRAAMPVALLSFLLGLAPAGRCQSPEPPLPLGSRVRITYERPETSATEAWRPLLVQEGRLAGWTAESIALESDGRASEIPVALLSRLEVSRGTTGHALTGALIGAGVGAVGTVVLMIGSAGDSEYTAGLAFLLGTGMFVLPGIGIGAGIGALVRTDRWETVPLPGGPAPVRPAVVLRVPVGP
jgi:hypothetical protein